MPSTTPEEPWALPELTRARRAIVVVDVVESVRLMQEDEAGFIERWRRFVHEVRTKLLPQHGGRMVKSLGDGMLLAFEAARTAVDAAQLMHALSKQQQGTLLELRIGIHDCDVAIDELDVYGNGVNLTARLGTLARPGDIVISSAVRDSLVPELDPDVEDLGECFVKHLAEPVRAWRVSATGLGEHGAPACADAGSLLPTIAVVPFRSAGGAQVEMIAGDALADGLTAELSCRTVLRVLSQLSSGGLRGRDPLPWQRLREHGVVYIVSGRCRVHGQRVHVTAELAEVASETAAWSGRLDGDLADLLHSDSRLVGDLRAAVDSALAHVELRRVRAMPLPTLQSYALQLAAVSMMHRASRADFDRVQPVLEHLIERHGRIASPRAWLAKWHVLRMTRGWVADPAREARVALDQTRRALDADPDSALALAVEGFVMCHMSHDLSGAARRLDAALAVQPSEAMAWLFRGAVHAFSDEGAAAVTCVARAQALSPMDPLKYYFDSLSAAAAVTAGQYERAIEWAERSLKANAMHSSTYRSLAIAQVLCGRSAEAAVTVERLLAIEPGFCVDGFLRRVPCGADAPIARRFARALADAGVPLH